MPSKFDKYLIGKSEDSLNKLSEIIPTNKTLFVSSLNDDIKEPEVVEGLQSLQDAFDYFKPECEIEIENLEGKSNVFSLKFKSLEDFELRNVINEIEPLSELESEKDSLVLLVNQLKFQESMQKVLENSQIKADFLATLEAAIDLLEEEE